PPTASCSRCSSSRGNGESCPAWAKRFRPHLTSHESSRRPEPSSLASSSSPLAASFFLFLPLLFLHAQLARVDAQSHELALRLHERLVLVQRDVVEAALPGPAVVEELLHEPGGLSQADAQYRRKSVNLLDHLVVRVRTLEVHLPGWLAEEEDHYVA